MSGKEEKKEENDAEELAMVGQLIEKVGDLLKSIAETTRNIVNDILKTIEGDKLGAEVAAFYKQLRDAGVPEDLANKMTMEFFEKRTAAAEALKDLPKLLQTGFGKSGSGLIGKQAKIVKIVSGEEGGKKVEIEFEPDKEKASDNEKKKEEK